MSLSLSDYISIANVIRSTSLPNYRQARLPVHSNLKIQASEKLLVNAPNNRLLDYLKFGFPLSIIDHESLDNTEITKHFSALQYPEAVNDYLHKEVNLVAILGPFDAILYHEYYCSPLLTRLKDLDKKRVILNFSYPSMSSVNDKDTSNLFDFQQFI